MNKAAKAILTGVTGTSVMTLGSELMSLIGKENFKEPEHLETLITRLAPTLSGKAKQLAGWGAHYAMGLVFATIYVELWDKRKIRHNFRNALILGILSGFAGLLIWKGTFKAHPLPPWLNYNHFYLQRIPAHIIFAVAATITYRLLPKSDDLTIHEN